MSTLFRPSTKTELGRDGAPPPPAEPLTANERTAATVLPAPDAVDAYGDDSFPASDPPGWWAGR